MIRPALLLAALASSVAASKSFPGGGFSGVGGSQAAGGGGYSYDAPSNAASLGLGGAGAGAGPRGQDPLAALAASIPGGGVPGQDFPVLAAVPDTAFSCQDQEFPGYFADTAEEAACQVFHICQFDGRHDSFLCPNGTLFNQQYLVCDWWFNVDCAASQQFFAALNQEIGRVPEGGQTTAGSFGSRQRPAEPSNSLQAPSQLYGTPDRG